jgi:hypothetical protein
LRQLNNNSKQRSANHKSSNNGGLTNSNSQKQLDRPLSLNNDAKSRKSTKLSSSLKKSNSQQHQQQSNAVEDDVKNIPAEELLELGIQTQDNTQTAQLDFFGKLINRL